MKTKPYILGYDMNGLYRTLRLLLCLTPCLQQLQLRSPRSGGITCFNLTISQFIKTTHLLLPSHASQKGSQTHLTPPRPSPVLGSHSSNSFRNPKLGHMAVLKVDQTSLVYVMYNPV